MNARCHRILFNRTRGLPMVVAETARAHDTHGKGQAFSPPTAPTRDDWPSRYRRPVALAMLLAFSNQYLVAPAHAQIVAYKAAPAKQRPTVLNASNGVALINIQTPSAAGVSHNLYDQFDVSAQGAILNNSQGNTQTQLGGWVQGNPMLAAGSARVILNEVVTAAPSQLHGHIEVAGSPAQVVIANPAGITCNGCGFINASRTTLTTGSPLITHGTLNGYRVEGGAIRIEGAGMDTRSASYTDLIARAVQINAGLWAQTLTVSTGAHIADATLTHFTPLAPAPDTTPSFAIDVASLGGMYAGKIKLVGTETGVGVRNAGHIGASAGEVHVTADGRLENIGSISAASDINITTRTAILSTGTLSAGSDLRLSADTLELAGSTHSARKLSFTAHAGHIDLSNSTNHADDTLTAHSAQALIHSGAQSHAKQLELTAHSLDNRLGRIVQTGGGNIAITLTGDLDNREGLLASNARNLSLSSAHLDNADGHIEHAGDGTLAITTGTLTGTHGRIASNGTLDLAAHTLKLDHADTAADTLVLHADSLSHEGGQLVQHGAGTGHIAITHGFDNRQATIIANGSLHIAADTLDNRHARIATGTQLSLSSQHIINDSGQLAAGQDLTALLSGALTNTFGTIAAGRNLDLSAAVLDNRNGTLGAVAGTLSATLAAEADNRSGRLEAAQALSLIASGVDNTDGTLLGGSLELDTRGHELINAGGRLLADVHLDVRSGALDNASGLIHAGGDLSIDTHGHTLTNTHSGLTGGILGQHSVTLTTAALDNTAGFIGAGDTLELLADKVHNTTGRIVSTTSIAGAMRRLDNQAGTIETHGALTITADEHIDNHAGLMRSGQTLELHTASLDNRNTLDTDQGIQGRTLDIAVSTLDNRSGALRADTRLAIASSGTLDNRGGLVSSAEEISVSDPSAATTLAITNTDGTFIAGQQLNITAHQFTGGKLLSLNDLAIGLGGDLDNVDEITANHNATLSAAGTLANHGTLQAGNLLALTAGTLDNRANGKIIAPTLSLASTATHTLTNRGLIDGGQTRIDAVTLQNLGTGRLYGDHLAIAANALLNAAEGADQPVIAARNRLDLAVSTLDNRDGALIFSAGDMAIGGALDASHRATGRAGTVTNASATFEALGELALEATALSNIDIHFLTGVVDSGPIDVQAYQNYGAPYRYTDDQVSTYLAKPNSEQWVLYLSTPTETSNHWYRYDYSLHTSETVVLERQAANIQAGGALRIDAIEVLNDKSHLLAGGDLTIAADILNNIDATGQRIETATGTVTRYWRNKRSSGLPAQGIETSAYAAAPVVETFNLATAIYGGNQLFSGSGFNDAAHTAASVDHVAGGSQPITAALADSSPAPRIVQIAPTAADGAAVATVNAPIHLPGGSLYQPSPTAPYL
ncbi:filamentous hemagglutinin N-terminal domain-containing protein, partial [Azoarcus communis]|uniref:two-partner secretion domain-containing protein n=1 Tax=Parazoarcus communis TaxID=41977 RepID=UPI0014597A0D